MRCPTCQASRCMLPVAMLAATVLNTSSRLMNGTQTLTTNWCS